MHYLLKFQIFTRLNLFVTQPLTSLGGLPYSRVIMLSKVSIRYKYCSQDATERKECDR